MSDTLKEDTVRAVTLGIEDALVSSIGLMAGITAAGMSHKSIKSCLLITILTQAISMALGSFLAEDAAAEITGKNNQRDKYFISAAMGLSFVTAGFLPFLPLLLTTNPELALMWAMGISLLSLFGLGYHNAPHSPLWGGIRTVVLGGAAIFMGVMVGDISR